MSQYQVPQFIERENKIIGPFTFKQFIYLASGVSIIYIFQFIIPNTIIKLILSVLVAVLFTGLAFLKLDGVPLPQYLVRAVLFFLGQKRYIYHDSAKNDTIKDILKQP